MTLRNEPNPRYKGGASITFYLKVGFVGTTVYLSNNKFNCGEKPLGPLGKYLLLVLHLLNPKFGKETKLLPVRIS